MKNAMSRREFIKKSTAAGIAVGLTSSSLFAQTSRNRKALVVYGGWKGHEPSIAPDLVIPWMDKNGFQITSSESLDAYADKELMNSIDLVVQTWTMGEISKEQSNGLLSAVKNGVGIAGWHGGLGDSFRNNPTYQYMVGGQWVAHPGGQIEYEVNITDKRDPVTNGMKDFTVQSEQYYMHVDPANKVLATTTFSDEHDPWVDGAVMPVVWKKMYGKGRVFYSALGHDSGDFKETPEIFTLMQRGMKWAAESKYAQTPHLVSSVYPRR
jgi:hypothetical protein